jgi:hypothetical protein
MHGKTNVGLNSKLQIGSNTETKITMHESSRQALLSESKAELTRRKERLLMPIISLVPKWSGSESAILLEKFIENIESTAKIGRWHLSHCLKLAASNVADPASSRFNSCPKFQGKRYARNLKRRLNIDLRHEKGGDGKRETRTGRETRASAQDRTKLSRTQGINLSCAIAD